MQVSSWNKASSARIELHLTQVSHSLVKSLTTGMPWMHEHTKIRSCKSLTNTREHNIHTRCFIPAFCYSSPNLMGNTKATSSSSSEKGLWIILGHRLNTKYPCRIQRQTEPQDTGAAMSLGVSQNHFLSVQGWWGLHWSRFWYWQLVSERRWRCCRQHRANRMIRGLWDMTYKERLKELGYFA